MSTVTVLASSQINGADTLTVELIEADDTPAVVIVRWPSKPSVLHPRRFRLLLMWPHGLSLQPSLGWLRFDGTASCERPTVRRTARADPHTAR